MLFPAQFLITKLIIHRQADVKLGRQSHSESDKTVDVKQKSGVCKCVHRILVYFVLPRYHVKVPNWIFEYTVFAPR
jgi:hypothetical protein